MLQGGEILWCSIVANQAIIHGGGVYSYAGTGPRDISYSIIAFADDGGGVCATEGHLPSLLCCDVYANDEGDYDDVVGDQTGINHNFSADPEFCDRLSEDYRLFDTSPCLPSASPCGEQVGRFGQACSNPVSEMSWGRVKGLWGVR
jgi:hypothetical protein